METYNGHVRTPNDAIILFEACRLGLLPRVQRRLSEKERQSIRSGSVFVWDEREAGMRRWTDGKSWSASRVSGSFLTYREMEGKRGGSNFVTPVGAPKTPESGRNSTEDPNAMDGEEGPDGYRYKPDGLMKQSFSLTTSQGQHLHLISYYSRSHPTAQVLRQPSNDASVSSIQIPKGMYPESTVADASNTPAVTKSPMPGAPNYVMAPNPAYARQPPPPPGYFPGFIPHPAAGYMYPISPLHTPPGHYHLYAHPGMPPLGYAPAPYGAPPPPPPPLHHHFSAAPPSAYDQRPLRNSIPASQPPQRTHSAPNAPLSPQARDQPPPSALTNGEQSERPAGHQSDSRSGEQHYSDASQNSGPPQLPQEHIQLETRPPESIPITASQAPTIGALMNGTTSAPPVIEKDKDRQGSVSPGGTKYGAPPQDIPSEKLAFREDKLALGKLDRAFARV